MAVCRHCGAIFEDELKVCPDCGQENTDRADESYLDDLLNSLVSSEPVRPAKKDSVHKTEVQEPVVKIKNEVVPETLDADFFNPDEDLELEEYNIFDELEDVDVEALIAQELQQGEEASVVMPENTEEDFDLLPEDDIFALPEEVADDSDLFAMPEEDMFIMPEVEEPDIFALTEDTAEEPDVFSMLNDMEVEQTVSDEYGEAEPEENQEEGLQDLFSISEDGLDELAYAGLDDLLAGFDESELEEFSADTSTDQGLEELLAAEIEEADETDDKKTKSKKKDDRSIWQRLFGNVPIDPSKKKPEPTPEEIEAKKQAKEEQKKKTAEEKKIASEEKKAAAKAAKEEKAKQAQIKKEEKKQKKLEEAKQLLEEMEETRINRLGASIIFILFAIFAIFIIVGSNLFTYSINIANAEKNFNQALNHDVKYYTEAYNHIYGLEMRNLEDQELEDKIMTVMFVNKELNSYNSHMAIGDYETALHSLVKGIYRYGKYFDTAKELSIDEDMDFVRTQILKELEATFDVSEDEAERLCSLLTESLENDEKALEYSIELYKIVDETLEN